MSDSQMRIINTQFFVLSYLIAGMFGLLIITIFLVLSAAIEYWVENLARRRLNDK